MQQMLQCASLVDFFRLLDDLDDAIPESLLVTAMEIQAESGKWHLRACPGQS